MKTYGEVDVEIRVFFTSAIFKVEWSDLRPIHFTPRETAPLPVG
jgi:hypothetical protein